MTRPAAALTPHVAVGESGCNTRAVPERRNITSGSHFEPSIGFSRAVRIGDRVLVSGTGPIWPDGSCPDDPGAQARRCLHIIRTALVEAGTDLSAVIRTRMYLTDAAAADAVSAEHGRHFADIRPAATMVIVAGLLDPRWKVEIEAEALAGSR
jgi:enamine deaminase RidA (YjgF/YER057c/UK114 family)